MSHQQIHNKSVTFDCTEFEIIHNSELDLDLHLGNIHEPVKNSQIHQCSKCDFQSLESRDLNAHVQTNHKSVMINIDVEEQIALNCQQCEYKCRLNIQLKKHIETKHKVKDDTKYNCKECG